jgi:hypothetical protein
MRRSHGSGPPSLLDGVDPERLKQVNEPGPDRQAGIKAQAPALSTCAQLAVMADHCRLGVCCKCTSLITGNIPAASGTDVIPMTLPHAHA